MSAVLALIPVALAAAVCIALHRVNRACGWFRTGELVFWDIILLILVYLAWLRWF